MSDIGREGVVCVDGWAGRREFRIKIIRETPKKYYEVEFLEPGSIPNRIYVKTGETAMVPKRAVRL